MKYLALFCTLFGVLAIFLYTAFTQNSVISNWLLWGLLAPSQVVPLLGLGIGLALVNYRLSIVCILTFLMSFFVGIYSYEFVWRFFLVDASKHLYLALPVANLACGILLIFFSSWRKWLVLPVSFVVGFMYAVTIKLTDPTLHDAIIPKIGVLLSVWLVLCAMLMVRVLYKKWFNIPVRILGSWLLASALLYGGTALGVKYGAIKQTQKAPTIKNEKLPDINLVPEFD